MWLSYILWLLRGFLTPIKLRNLAGDFFFSVRCLVGVLENPVGVLDSSVGDVPEDLVGAPEDFTSGDLSTFTGVLVSDRSNGGVPVNRVGVAESSGLSTGVLQSDFAAASIGVLGSTSGVLVGLSGVLVSTSEAGGLPCVLMGDL